MDVEGKALSLLVTIFCTLNVAKGLLPNGCGQYLRSYYNYSYESRWGYADIPINTCISSFGYNYSTNSNYSRSRMYKCDVDNNGVRIVNGLLYDELNCVGNASIFDTIYNNTDNTFFECNGPNCGIIERYVDTEEGNCTYFDEDFFVFGGCLFDSTTSFGIFSYSCDNNVYGTLTTYQYGYNNTLNYNDQCNQIPEYTHSINNTKCVNELLECATPNSKL